jgi:60 kDa SS-A/Ro ribonucleoprotein
MRYTQHTNDKQTPQSQPVFGRESEQVQNSAGGYVFAVDDWTRLNRFLVLGSEGGTYYASEQKLTVENAQAILRCIRADGLRTVKIIEDISVSGRAPKNDPAIFALALALKKGDEATRKAAAVAVPKVCRIGTHLFHLAQAVEDLGGWGRNTRRAFANWYSGRDEKNLAMQLVKYQQRDGWSHRDVLRKTHAALDVADVRWAVGGNLGERRVGGGQRPERVYSGSTQLSPLVAAFEKAKTASAKEIVTLIHEFGLPREAIPTQHLNEVEVWDALLTAGRGMPFAAMIRNLGKMTAVGLIKPLSNASKHVVEALGNEDQLKRARIHPLNVLLALKTYAQGRGVKGKLTWSPDQNVVDALDKAFYASFAQVESTGKRWVLACDISGSMGSLISGYPISCREAVGALAMVTAKTEPQNVIVGFTNTGWVGGPSVHYGYNAGITQINISPRKRLDRVCTEMAALPMGGTDCALPMLWAKANKIDADVFVVLTDNETWAGNIHPFQALKDYRQSSGIDAKLAVVGMTASGFSIADPTDSGMLDFVGFDAALPTLLRDFATGGAGSAGADPDASDNADVE